MTHDTYDYIIVGAGSALGARESALRVEAGGEHRRPAQMRGGAHPKGRPKLIDQLEADVRRP